MSDVSMDKIVSLAKRRGFIYPGSEIYGGLAGTWDYGPLGVELKNNVKNLWWRMFVHDREDMAGVDAAILMNSRAWEASGHVSGFSDPLVDCKKCNSRQRTDQLVGDKKETYLEKINVYMNENVTYSRSKETAFLEHSGIPYERSEAAHKALAEYVGPLAQRFLIEYIDCPVCGSRNWSEPRKFNMMFKTHAGASTDDASATYLRPETAGGIFVNFKNVVDSLHPKLPFGIAQIGKAFRNEIAPRDFIFRSREFEQMEIEYFVHPKNWEEVFSIWQQAQLDFADAVGLDVSLVKQVDVPAEDRAHYSKHSIDTEFIYPFGQKELWGLAYRTDFDLQAHAKASGQELSIMIDDATGEKIVPHVIEPSFGVDRTILAILASAYTEDELGGEVRTYLKFAPAVAPIKAAVFPLLKNKPELVAKAREVYAMLKKEVPQIMWDDNGNIGKRYRRQDEIGTPLCITIDFDTLGENPELLDTVTVRNRDTGEQERVSISALTNLIK